MTRTATNFNSNLTSFISQFNVFSRICDKPVLFAGRAPKMLSLEDALTQVNKKNNQIPHKKIRRCT